MYKIYATASRTIVWLGEATADSDDAISILEDSASKVEHNASHESQSRNASDILRKAHNITESDTEKWKALANFGSRSWWSRVWVMQEIACSKKASIVQCGHRITNWKKLVVGIHVMYDRIVGMAAISETFRPAHKLERALLMQSAESFYEALERGRGAADSDNRDKVFGVLHLSKRDDGINLAADYNNNIVEVYTATARLLLSNFDDLRLLALCDHCDGPVEQWLGLYDSQTSGLPSWVPDWADRRPYSSISRHISDEMVNIRLATGCVSLRRYGR